MPINGTNKETVLGQILDSLRRIVEVAQEGAIVGIKKRLNFIAGENVTLDIVDNPTKNQVDITIGATGGGGISDGDKGDITVSGSGTVFTIDDDVVTDAKLRNSAAISVIGRSDNSVGDPADIAAASVGDVLRVAGAPPVLGFGSIPESSVTNLVTDLAGKVPTSRLVNTTAPITGGGDLSADRTIAFDSSALLDNNARVKVDKNGTGVGTRRELNFIEGSNITLTITDDNANEKVDITIAGSGGGSGLTHPQVMSRALQLC